MACKNSATCEFCDSICAAFVVDRQLWQELCVEYKVWCPFEKVKGIPYTKAVEYFQYLDHLISNVDIL